MKTGSVVRDKDPSYGEGLGVVIGEINKPSKDVIVESEGKTVSELNPNCDENSEVVEVVFKTKLDYNLPNWWMLDGSELIERIENVGINSYKYPTDSLTQVNDSGLIDGVKINIVGVSDPLKNTKGSYAFQVENSDVSYSQSSMVSDYSKITDSISYLEGMIDALSWLDKNMSVDGVQFVVEDDSIEDKINGDTNIQNEDMIGLIHRFNSMIEDIEKIEFRNVMKSEIQEVDDMAVRKYKKLDSGEESGRFEVDKIVENEYLVDGVYSVNISQDTCTCEEIGECEHIQYIKRESD